MPTQADTPRFFVPHTKQSAIFGNTEKERKNNNNNKKKNNTEKKLKKKKQANEQ